LIIRDLNNEGWLNTRVYNTNQLKEITAVKWSHNGYFIAYGDESGGVRVIGLDASKNYVIKYENENLLGGRVYDLNWSDDNPQKLLFVGSG